MEGLQPKNFIEQLKMDGTFNEASFDREFESKWAGSIEGAFFDINKFSKLPENEPNGRNNKDAYYIMGVDVGRFGCTTEVCVLKVSPPKSKSEVFIKQLVNQYSFDEEHFGMQAIKLKHIFKQFKCRIAVVDGNGLGAGLVDFLVIDQDDPDTGEPLGNWGVYNDDDRKYKKFENESTIQNAMYIMKATNVINSELYAYTQSQMSSGKLRFLIDENTAKNKLMSQSNGKKMSVSRRADYLRPFVMTSILRDQMANLIEEHDGALIILKQSTRTIKKDKFSAYIYALAWTKMQEESKQRKSFDVSRMMLFSRH